MRSSIAVPRRVSPAISEIVNRITNGQRESSLLSRSGRSRPCPCGVTRLLKHAAGRSMNFWASLQKNQEFFYRIKSLGVSRVSTESDAGAGAVVFQSIHLGVNHLEIRKRPRPSRPRRISRICQQLVLELIHPYVPSMIVS